MALRSRHIPRRVLLEHGLAGLAAMMAPPFLVGCGSDAEAGSGAAGTGGAGGAGGSAGGAGSAGAGGAGGAGGAPAIELGSNIGSLGDLGDADANGVRLPAGFTSRVVARSGEKPVATSDYPWHTFPDGGAVFATDGGGWIYVSNSEFPSTGGVGALEFDASGEVVRAYPILANTSVNCGGGATPWGTWLSCEEVDRGRVFECDPTGADPAIERPALGIFKHEAAAVDVDRQRLYLTEDVSNGGFYRFVPDAMVDGHADLSSGALEIAEVGGDGAVTWHPLQDPTFAGGTATRSQIATSTAFEGGEGVWYHAGKIYFSTKGDNKVWRYDVETEMLDVLYDAATAVSPILTGVDNLVGSCCGDILVAEDGGDMQIVAILPDGSLKPIAQIVGQDSSEITGPAFDPSGTRLYFSSQRGTALSGMTFEVSGPFHSRA